MQAKTSQNQSTDPLVPLTKENAIAELGEPLPCSFAEIVGQIDAVRRIAALVNLARRRDEALGHILLFGPEGSSKRMIAYVIAREVGVNVREASVSGRARGGDLAAIINDLEKGDIFLLRNLGQLRNDIVEMLASTLLA
jgi:Holliday junction DNA helicase RuvB